MLVFGPTATHRADENAQSIENKPATPEMETLVSFTRLANPQVFANPKFLEQLHNMGAPPSMLRRVASEQGVVGGTLVNQKPDPISAGEVWTVAKPAFEASGIFLDTTEAKDTTAKTAERMADADRKMKAVGFLRDVATTWAKQNPGQKPDQSLIKGWVGQALRAAPGGARIFDGDPHQVVGGMPPEMRQQGTRALQRAGVPISDGSLYSWYKALVASQTRPADEALAVGNPSPPEIPRQNAAKAPEPAVKGPELYRLYKWYEQKVREGDGAWLSN